MFSLQNPRIILHQAKKYAKKALGQHFLMQSDIARSMVEQADICETDQIIEIGPGLGALTVHLSRQSNTVYAIDLDASLLALLSIELEKIGIDNVNLIHGDILKVSLDSVISENTDARWIVMGNLPYHISSQIIVKLIKERKYISQAVVMLQKEMADRIQSPPGSKAYGRLSVMLQYCARIHPLMQISGNDFFPRVKVDSQVIQIQFLDHVDPAVYDENALFKVVKAAFGKRRKTIVNALRSGLTCDADFITDALVKVGIDPRCRAESISVNDFVRLTNQMDGYL